MSWWFFFALVIPKMLQALFGIHSPYSNEGIDFLYDGGSQIFCYARFWDDKVIELQNFRMASFNNRGIQIVP
jgi:hypothetical protein